MTRAEPPRRFTTRAQTLFRQGGRKRLAGAALVAVAALCALVLLGPDEESIKRRFEYYGAPDELHIMPEISIDEGADEVHQLPASLQRPPPPAEIESEPEDLDDRAVEEVPERAESESEVVQPVPVADPEQIETTERVELRLPQQSNPDWYIIREERPSYPLDAPESERRIPTIFVRAAIFVGRDGLVKERLVLGTNGSRVFADAVLEALAQWEFGWRVDPGSGRWIEMTWNFRSPYFTPGR